MENTKMTTEERKVRVEALKNNHKACWEFKFENLNKIHGFASSDSKNELDKLFHVMNDAVRDYMNAIKETGYGTEDFTEKIELLSKLKETVEENEQLNEDNMYEIEEEGNEDHEYDEERVNELTINLFKLIEKVELEYDEDNIEDLMLEAEDLFEEAAEINEEYGM